LELIYIHYRSVLKMHHSALISLKLAAIFRGRNCTQEPR